MLYLECLILGRKAVGLAFNFLTSLHWTSSGKEALVLVRPARRALLGSSGILPLRIPEKNDDQSLRQERDQTQEAADAP